MPECCDPREISAEWDAWVLKACYSNTGDRVLILGNLARKDREQAIRKAQRHPSGWFDNRSFVASSDFPSADYFRRHGISKVILVQPTSRINTDLLHAARRPNNRDASSLGTVGAPPVHRKAPDIPGPGLGMARPAIRLPAQRLSFILRRIDSSQQ